MRSGMDLNSASRRREIPAHKLWARLILWWTWGLVLLGMVGLLIPAVQPFQDRWSDIGLPLVALLTIGANRRQTATALTSAVSATILVFLIFTIDTANFEPERMRWLTGGVTAVTFLLVGLAAETAAITTRLPGLIYWRAPAAGLILALAVGLVGGLVAATGPDVANLGLGQAFLRGLNSGIYQEFVFRAFLLTVLTQIILGRLKGTSRAEQSLTVGGSERWLGPVLLAALAQGAAHTDSGFWPLLSSIAFGVGFGWLYIRYGLAFAALAHVITDFLQVLR